MSEKNTKDFEFTIVDKDAKKLRAKAEITDPLEIEVAPIFKIGRNNAIFCFDVGAVGSKIFKQLLEKGTIPSEIILKSSNTLLIHGVPVKQIIIE